MTGITGGFPNAAHRLGRTRVARTAESAFRFAGTRARKPGEYGGFSLAGRLLNLFSSKKLAAFVGGGSNGKGSSHADAAHSPPRDARGRGGSRRRSSRRR